jgi:V/A-type H+-transporting ATPase subunit C
MSEGSYEFLNTRIRAISRALLPAEFFEEVLGASGDDPIIDVLLDSPYEQALREALTVSRGVRALESAIGRHLHEILSKVRNSAVGDPKRIVDAQLSRWDVGNIVAIVRGKLVGASEDEILQAVLPVAQYSEPQLRELAAERDVQGVADALTTWNYQFGFIARRVLRDFRSAEDMTAIEQQLYRVYFSWALASFAQDDENEDTLRSLLRMQVDLQNTLAALRVVRYREVGRELPNYLPIPAGKLVPDLLERLVAARRLEDAFEILSSTYFAEGIDRGILAFGQAHRLSVMERFLEMVIIGAGARLYRGDPLGAGVPLGFIWRVINEFLNLRILVRGKAYGIPANTIREELLIL